MANAQAGGRMNEVKKQATEFGEDIREFTSSVGEIATRKLDPIVEYIEENPVQAVLMAVGVGVLIGMFLKR